MLNSRSGQSQGDIALMRSLSGSICIDARFTAYISSFHPTLPRRGPTPETELDINLPPFALAVTQTLISRHLLLFSLHRADPCC